MKFILLCKLINQIWMCIKLKITFLVNTNANASYLGWKKNTTSVNNLFFLLLSPFSSFSNNSILSSHTSLESQNILSWKEPTIIINLMTSKHFLHVFIFRDRICISHLQTDKLKNAGGAHQAWKFSYQN